jgi:hypothetical protein
VLALFGGASRGVLFVDSADGLIAGPVAGLAGYAALAIAGATAAAALVPVLLAVARRGIPSADAPASRILK